ncbi:MAG: hypothetical protein AAF950_16345, partial [Pseudomonadota bacterium]
AKIAPNWAKKFGIVSAVMVGAGYMIIFHPFFFVKAIAEFLSYLLANGAYTTFFLFLSSLFFFYLWLKALLAIPWAILRYFGTFLIRTLNWIAMLMSLLAKKIERYADAKRAEI